LWQHKELHDLYKKSGFKEEDFVSRTMDSQKTKVETLSRPVGHQGNDPLLQIYDTGETLNLAFD